MINLETKNWKIENIETVLFDKDGTFVDLHYFWGKVTEFRVTEIIDHYKLNQNLFNSLCLFLGYNCKTGKMKPDGITALYSRPVIIEMFKNELIKYNSNANNKTIENIFNEVTKNFNKKIEKYIKPIPEAIDFIKILKKEGIKLGIVTSDSIISTNLTLKYLNLENYFDVVIARESHPETKESGKPTILAIEKLNANPKNTIIIGDTPMDAQSGKNAGLKASILISTGQVEIDSLKIHSQYCENSLNNVKLNRLLETNNFVASKN